MALMQRHHIGSGRRRTIPDNWSAHHRSAVDGTHTCVVSLRRPGGVKGAFDPVSGTYPVTPKPTYYTGAARVQMVSDSDLKRTVADQQVSTLVYRVGLDHEVVGMELGDMVKIVSMDENGDPAMIGRELTVDTIVWSSLLWERVLVCVDDLERLS